MEKAPPLSVSKKSAYGVLFRDLRRFPLAPMGLPGGKRRKETLHSKVSESAAHVAGFGLHLEGFGPPNLPKGFFDSLSGGALPMEKAPPLSGVWLNSGRHHAPAADAEASCTSKPICASSGAVT